MTQSQSDKADGVAGTLGSLKIVPVEPGHEHEPDEFEANIDLRRGIVYVRAEDWPKLRDELGTAVGQLTAKR